MTMLLIIKKGPSGKPCNFHLIYVSIKTLFKEKNTPTNYISAKPEVHPRNYQGIFRF